MFSIFNEDVNELEDKDCLEDEDISTQSNLRPPNFALRGKKKLKHTQAPSVEKLKPKDLRNLPVLGGKK